MTVDHPDWGQTQDAANKIATTGVPLLSGLAQLSTNTLNIPAGNAPALPPITVTQIGWELGLSFSAAAGSNQPLRVSLTWKDSASGLITDVDAFGIRAGSVANPHVVRIFGRTKGDTVVIEFDNTATGNAATVTYTFLQNSRVYSRESFKTISWGTVGVDNLPNFDVPESVIAQVNATVTATTTVAFHLPAYDGDVQVCAVTSSGTTDLNVSILDSNSHGQSVVDVQSNGSGLINQTVTLPRAQCLMQVRNGNAANQPITVEIVARGTLA